MVFAIVFTLIIIGMIFALGFTQIQDFFCLGANAQATKAVTDLESLVEEVYVLAEGSGKNYPLALPSGVKVCFVNEQNPDPRPWPDPGRTWNPDRLILEEFLKNPASPSYRSNTWIYFCGKPLGEGYKIPSLSPSESFCAQGGDKLFLENKGTFVDVSPV